MVADYYRSLELGRLVVLGELGAGKTVLALRLTLDLITAYRARHDRSRHTRVPVRLNLSTFTLPLGSTDPALTRAAADEWIAAHLTRVYGIRRAVAATLVADGWVLPVLDGLDEMDADNIPPLRAQQLLAGLNYPIGPAPGPVVLTCRRTACRRTSWALTAFSREQAIKTRLWSST